MRTSLRIALAVLASLAGNSFAQPKPGAGPRQYSNTDLGYEAPTITEFVIQPLDFRDIDETRGLVEVLSQRFPGLHFSLKPLGPLPDGVLNELGQVRAELILSTRRPRGTIVIVSRDLSEDGANFIYGYMDPMTSNGVVSVSRFRTATGSPAPDTVVLTEKQRALATTRLHNQVTSTIAKSFGLNFPCTERKCVLRFARGGMSDFDDKGGAFCAKHVQEFGKIIGARSHDAPEH